MPIRVRCESCGAAIDAPEKYAGQRAKCAKCGAVLTVPNLASDVPDRSVPESLPIGSARQRRRPSAGLWLLACALLSGAAFVGAYLLCTYRIESLRTQNEEQANRLASLDRQLAGLKGTAASALKLAEQLQSRIAD